MSMDQLLETIRRFDGVLELAPTADSLFPEIAWGDHFFYYAPNGQVPQREQPYATIVTKNYPDDASSDLDRPGRWRLNIHVGRSAYIELLGEDPRLDPVGVDFTAVDTLLPHPGYHAQGWVSIINPAARTGDLALSLLGEAHDAARRRATRRTSSAR
ncbi:DUF6194 family protein [Mycolicibacterium sp. HK-90]|uniref:DUF6194 family protein n=1 Tax=Mycolicibacterium sp. HK-90 TaxID=3056937 RepID=UPI00265A89A0|nr:DUF6194 family protein [Mycolicibacterium sp. HK-90]WKG04074.1 DUF6194 family protein [Mycolicibacterium sp. HK-90]